MSKSKQNQNNKKTNMNSAKVSVTHIKTLINMLKNNTYTKVLDILKKANLKSIFSNIANELLFHCLRSIDAPQSDDLNEEAFSIINLLLKIPDIDPNYQNYCMSY